MFQGFEVVNNAVGGSDAEGGADFPYGGGGPCSGSVNADETEDRLLFYCESFHALNLIDGEISQALNLIAGPVGILTDGLWKFQSRFIFWRRKMQLNAPA